jgi:N-acetylated-alpha-linked acidic dipeptidase
MTSRSGWKSALSATAGALAFLAAAVAGDAATSPILGFSPAGAEAERAVEARFDSGLSADSIRERLRLMSAEPNQVGSPHDKANADYTLAQFKAWGWDAHIEVFSVLYPTPKAESLDLLGPAPYKAGLTEPPIPGDDSSARQAGGLPAYVAYGADGDVTAPLIYVNYGMPADYEALARLGLDVKGKIVIARYGAGWRGLKPKLAYEHGAVGCIIYSDPADDGYGAGDAYPKGAFRPEFGLQRGSVQDIPVESGDPLTPGYGAVEGAPRLTLAQAKTILHIPVIPISWGDAKHFLAALEGPIAPKGWRGALPFTYHVGGAGVQAHLMVQSNWDQKPLYDVIAVMKGSRAPDQWVIRGNHRDGWVFGAQDPLSGQSALMEEAKALGALAKTGWRPARTLVYASWDGEEPGLLGSTEWAETHAEALQAKAVLYVNTDGNDRGTLSAETSYSLRHFLDQTAAAVSDPETGASVRDRALAEIQVKALATDASPETKARAKSVRDGGDLPLGDLGSGSDYTPFVQHLGVASINLGYGGEGQSGGVYHSAYDTFEHYERFGDPGFAYGVVLAKTAGRLVLRAADADLSPFQFADLAESVTAETAELKTLLANEREHALTLARLLDQHAFSLTADPTKASAPPPAESVPPALDFAALDAAAARLAASAKAYDSLAASGVFAPAESARADAILQDVEQALLDHRGLPGRPWYRHLVYAPGMLTGYGAKTLPGVREAIEGRRWEEASDYIGRTAAVLNAASAKIDQATAALRP